MNEKIARVGVDLAKRAAHVTAMDAEGGIVERKRLRRAGLQSSRYLRSSHARPRRSAARVCSSEVERPMASASRNTAVARMPTMSQCWTRMVQPSRTVAPVAFVEEQEALDALVGVQGQ